MKQFVVYELQRPDGVPFYVGKGHPRRPWDHIRQARRGQQSHKANVIRKIEREGSTVKVEVVFETDDEAEAFTEEIRRIAAYRVSGLILTNLKSGGQGGNHSAETRVKLSAANKGKKLSDATRAKISTTKMGRKHAEETKAKIRATKRAAVGWPPGEIPA
jgi:hypothetical protein